MHVEISAERRAFAAWLRSGRRSARGGQGTVELKFNPYHDPRNGQFTFGPGGSGAGGGRTASRRGRAGLANDGVLSPQIRSARLLPQASPTGATLNDAVFRPDGTPLLRDVAGGRAPPPIGSNSSAFFDPMTLDETFPGLRNSPGGSILAVADNVLDLTGPGQQTTTVMSLQNVKVLVEQIQQIDPTYRLQSLATPVTFDGQMNQINNLRLDRAEAFYSRYGETRPLQVETLRFLQQRTDQAYEEGLRRLKEGSLVIRLSREEALGNFVDRQVRSDLRDLFNGRGILTDRSSNVRVNSREYDSSGTDRTYRRPDARVDDVAFDVTLTPKTGRTQQVRGFFNSDFRPHSVVIVRPSQLGKDNTYIITRPRK